MELALSLGGVTKNNNTINTTSTNIVDFCMGLTPSRSTAEIKQQSDDQTMEKVASSSSSDPTADISPRQLELLPLSPLPRRCIITQPRRFPWLSDNLSSEPGSSDGNGPGSRMVEVNRRPAMAAEDGEEQSSPNSGTSSFMEFTLYNYNNNNNKNGIRRNSSGENNVQGVIVGGGGNGATTSRGSDDEENGSTRKKLRLSKEQSAFLEESFKEHHTLNPKQKQALAKELNLRPRQVEVWFQNRRARTKLKQTEVDCEYLKRCCETLTEENRRLQKELLDLRALKSSQPFFMHHPATTLTMCPSCERVAPTSTSTGPTKPVPSTSDDTNNNGVTLCLGKPNPNPTATTLDDANVNANAKPNPTATSLDDDNDDDTSNGVTLCLGKPKPDPNPNPKSMVPFFNASSQVNQATS